MIKQAHITLRPYPRGIHLVSSEVLRQLPPLPRTGLLHLLIQHTSAALALNENADPDVRRDLAAIFDRLVPETRRSTCIQKKDRTICPRTPKQ